MMKWRLLTLALLPLLICCKKQQALETNVKSKPVDSTLTFYNVVILGNSITYSPNNTPIGWFGDWGMAATVQDSDYVHILINHFKVKNPNVQVKVKNIEPFEVDPLHYDLDAELDALKSIKPDLVLIRIGENVSADVDLKMFNERYTALINYFKADNANVIVLSGGSIWGSVVDNVMIKHPPYVLLKSIVNDGSNFSLGLFTDAGVAAHPSDKGMRNIAALLWNKIKILTPDDRK